MKKVLLFSLFLIMGFSAKAVHSINWAQQFGDEPKVQALTPEMTKLAVDQFLALTPKAYKEMTGERLGFKKTIQLKAAQKFIKAKKNGAEDIEKGLYIVLAILGLGFIAMGLMDDWEGNNWWVNLILTALCWIPGVIHALIKMKEYYP
ncbi:YqaE/Pmp3 family membrane protein [Portibacter marinus]|uniref:YqaE/Pmp3 family membrane protein n=1 Tax=Portibacter marinus TaxID=2898660 RepID=UPI001F3FAEF9|nr:YqaE/Pmp3 family membrane protein [Portibacter marinus]